MAEVAVTDIDGTISDSGDPITGVIDHLRRRKAAGLEIYVVSARSTDDRDSTLRWLDAHDVPHDRLILSDGGDATAHKVRVARDLLQDNTIREWVENNPETRRALAELGINAVPPSRFRSEAPVPTTRRAQPVFTRSFPLEDIRIRSGGDGRTVEAYAAVFNAPVEIRDADGQYLEQIAPTAFNKTLSDNGLRFGVFYNHARTIYGTPSERFSMPIGTPQEIRVEARGLLTVTRYNATPVADEVLEAIRTGAITGQSFSGRFIASDTPRPRRGFAPAADGSLTVVTRTEIAMREYGPTPFPAYAGAEIVGVRAADLARVVREMDDDERAELASLLNLPAARLEDAARADDTAPDGPPSVAEPSEPIGLPAHLRAFQSSRLKARDLGAL